MRSWRCNDICGAIKFIAQVILTESVSQPPTLAHFSFFLARLEFLRFQFESKDGKGKVDLGMCSSIGFDFWYQIKRRIMDFLFSTNSYTALWMTRPARQKSRRRRSYAYERDLVTMKWKTRQRNPQTLFSSFLLLLIWPQWFSSANLWNGRQGAATRESWGWALVSLGLFTRNAQRLLSENYVIWLIVWRIYYILSSAVSASESVFWVWLIIISTPGDSRRFAEWQWRKFRHEGILSLLFLFGVTFVSLARMKSLQIRVDMQISQLGGLSSRAEISWRRKH